MVKINSNSIYSYGSSVSVKKIFLCVCGTLLILVCFV